MVDIRMHTELRAGVLVGGGGRILGYGLQYLFQAAVAQTLGPTLAGAAFPLLSLQHILAAVARWGRDVHGLMVIASSKVNAEDTTSLVWTGLLYTGGTGLALGLGVVVAGPLLMAAYRLSSYTAVLLVASSVPALAVALLASDYLRARFRMAASSLLQLVLLYSLALAGTGLVVLTGAPGLNSILGVFFVAAATTALLGVVVTAREFGRPQLQVSKPNKVANAFAFSTILSIAINNVDLVVVGIAAAPHEAAFYAVAVRTAMLASLGVLAVDSMIVPVVAREYSARRFEQLRISYQKAAGWAGLAGTVTAVWLALLNDVVISLFGPGFEAARGPLLLLLGAQVFNSSCGPVHKLLQMTGHVNVGNRILVYAVLLQAVGYVLLCPTLGAWGAAGVTATGLVLWNIALTLVCRRRLGFWPVSVTTIHNLALFTAAVSLPLLVIQLGLPEHLSLYACAALSLSAAAVYFQYRSR